MDCFKTVSKDAQVELKEKRSRFIGTIKPIQTEQEAIDFINKIKQKYWDAKHNVYAYVLQKGNIKRYSDDGEPHSTAGLPVLEIIKGYDLVDCVLVVTRYFGGILLGTGGLVRSYSQTARMVIEQAEVVIMKECTVYSVECDYSQHKKLEALIALFNGEIKDVDFSDKVKIVFNIGCDVEKKFNGEFVNTFGATINLQINGKTYGKFLKN